MADYTPYKRRKGVCNSYCNGCIYLGYATGDMKLCEYMLKTDKRRPCPAGTGCTVKQTGDRKLPWRAEADETWKVNQKKPKKRKHKEVYHKKCPVCGKIFETTKIHKIYCCEDCAIKGKVQKDVLRQALYRSLVEKDTYHRICPECGTEFDTTNERKQFCCRKCMLRYTQRRRIRQKNGIHPNGDANAYNGSVIKSLDKAYSK